MLQGLKKEKHRSAIHEERQKKKRGDAAFIEGEKTGEMKRLGPDEKRNAEKGSGDVTKNKDFDFLKPLHQSLAIHIIKGRSEAAAENKKIASEKFHGAKG